MKIIKHIFSILIIGLFLIPNIANALVISKMTDRVKVTMITDKDIVTSNSDLNILIKLEMKDDWHTYWRNPGDAGLPTKINWKLPSGYKSKILAWTAPMKFSNKDLLQYGYNNIAYIKAKIYPTNYKKKITANNKFEIGIEWLACKNLCVPELLNFNFYLPIQDKDPVISNLWNNEIKIAEDRFPKTNNFNAVYGYDNENFILNITSDDYNFRKDTNKIYFYPYDEDVIEYSSIQEIGCEDNNCISIRTKANEILEKNITGVLVVENDETSKSFEITAKKSENIKVYPVINYENKNLLYVLMIAFTGGLILNLMPCVFPILFIKTLSIVQSKDQKQARKASLFYFLGVITTFIAIASILFILRAGGANIGWGFQLQSPIFISIMIIIFFLIGLLLLDLISFGNWLSNKFGNIGSSSSFATGLLAVLVASPCTAPFMGVAIGYSLTQSYYIFFPVFLSLAIGYALPFTLVGFYPNLMMKILPRPGKWMITMKKLFAIPVFMTVLWLGWVLSNQIIVNNKISDNVVWKEYNKSEILELVQNREKVFINFTAKWCITCLVNEKIVFDKDEFKKLIKDENIHYYKADWTNKNSDLTIELESYGRNSVPLYIYYNGSKEYKILPQILSPSIVDEYLR